MELLRNSWVTGIITGIISGVVVYLITSKFFDSKGKKEYALHVKEANKDIVNALKPYIAEQGLPDFEVFRALILSTARKNAVDIKDLYTPAQYCEELIGEIIRDVYVSSDKKKEYSEAVSIYRKQIESEKLEETSLKGERQRTTLIAEIVNKQKDKLFLVASISTFIGTIIAFIIAVYSQGHLEPINEVNNHFEEHINTLIAILTAIATLMSLLAVTSTMVLDVFKRSPLKRFRKNKGKKNDKSGF